MQRLLAIALLTVKAALRFRLFWTLGALLFGSVVLLPALIHHDGTARGLTQIVLTYSLSVITALLGFVTLWLACGTLAREVEECQLQLVVVKPVARWQIWLGKWLGIMLINAVMLGGSGAVVYALLLWRAHRLPPEQQAVLRNEVLVARGSAKEELRDLDPFVEQVFQERLKQGKVTLGDRKYMRQQIREQAKAEFQLVRPGFVRRWVINLGLARHFLRDQPLFLRVKFTAAEQTKSTLDAPKTYPTLWQVGVPESPAVWRRQINLATDTFHEIPIPANLFDNQGNLTIDCINPNDLDLLFLLEDGLEVLYREGGFGLNFVRATGILFCWLALLAALGLAAASFLSFPVAAFVSLGILMMGLSSSTIAQVVEEGGISGVNHDTGKIEAPLLIDRVAVPLFAGLLKVVNLVRGFSPIDSLSSGRSVTWSQLAQAFGQIVLLMGGSFGVVGVILFERRELASAQGNQG